MLIEIRRVDGPVGFDGNVFLADYANAHFLAAYDGDEPVGQICHVNDGFFWWTDSLVVHQRMRSFGLALHLIEANYHLAIQNGIEVILARSRKGFGVQPDTFVRNNERMHLGDKHELTHEIHGAFYVRRDLTPLRESIERGGVQQIEFPYQVTLQQKAQSA